MSAVLRLHPGRLLGIAVLFFAALSATLPTARADAPRPLLSPIFGDNMVLQRGKPNTFWGWTTPGQTVRVSIAGLSASTTAESDGRWSLRLTPPPVGGPYEVKVEGPQTVALRNVLVGDVWLCGGQSNMEMSLKGVRDSAEEIKRADHPNIRLYKVAPRSSYRSADVPSGEWKECTPENAPAFSAVAYFFALKVQSEVQVPIGLVTDSLGGTPAESWMSAETLSRLGLFEPERKEIDRLQQRGGPEYGNYIMHWYDEYDAGIKTPEWFKADFDDSNWKRVQLMTGFAELGLAEVPGVVWFRREITLPDPLPTGDIKLMLGVVDKMDTAYLNGNWIGASSWVENPRAYRIDPKFLKPGKNQITIRVLKNKPTGGFQSPAESIRIALPDGSGVPLAGEWKAAVSVDARPPHPMPLGYENYPTMPTVLYRGMLAPVAPLAITGALWYQGEANFTRAYQYRTLLPAMIGDWRKLFGQGDFPFYIVSLPRFMQRKSKPGDDGWAELREAQAFVAQTVPNTGLAITIDSGDADNIHPIDKKVVGDRLALLALARTYGKPVAHQSPTFAQAEKLPGALKLHFAHAEGGLVARDGAPGEFAIAGADKVWHPAEAKIDGSSVIVSSPEVPEPVAARYAWQANPVATLFNQSGLPAAPFRTDDWKLSTQP